LRYLHQIWCAGTYGQSAACRDVILELQQHPRWRPTAILKNENRNSAAIWAIVAKFSTVVDMDNLQRAVTPFLTLSKSKMAADRHLEKKENRHISAAFWYRPIFTKFGVLVDIGSPHRPLVSVLDYNKIQDGGRPPFWKTENRKNSIAIRDLFTNSLVKPQILFIKNCKQFILCCISDIKPQKSKSISMNITH